MSCKRTNKPGENLARGGKAREIIVGASLLAQRLIGVNI